LPVDNYAASIEVEPKGDGSVVSWKAGYYRAYMNNNPPAEMNEEAANTAVTAILKTGLFNLKSLAEK
jgi:mxaD protein